MHECKEKDKISKRNEVLKTLKQMLCKLENDHYGKSTYVPPTLTIKAERCMCDIEKEPEGKVYPRQDLGGGEAFPFIEPIQEGDLWTPTYKCENQEYTPDMGCYRAAKLCKECDMCCECEVGQGSHVHLPKHRDNSKPLKDQCFPIDKCTTGNSDNPSPSCDPNNFQGRYFPKLDINCSYPQSCKATCFDHADFRDWAVSGPSYTYYVQKRTFTSF